jgi:hypothetical protein
MKRWISVLCLVLLTADVVSSNPKSVQAVRFETLEKEFESRMQRAAECWLKKQYSKALDQFYSGRDDLSENMPAPSNKFEWSACLALKTYAVLLARMVEADLLKSQRLDDMIPSVGRQIEDWKKILRDQSDEWTRLNSAAPWEEAVRSKWIRRFRSVLAAPKNTS